MGVEFLLEETLHLHFVYVPYYWQPQRFANCRDQFAKFAVQFTNRGAFANRLPSATANLSYTEIQPTAAHSLTLSVGLSV